MSSRLGFRVRACTAKLRGFLGANHSDDEFDDEIQEHLRLLAEKFAARGMSREDAAREARRHFGNTSLLREDRREMQTLSGIEALWQDLRYSRRTLWKNRGFAAVSIATLALGIGATTAIFSVIDNVLLEPFPYKDTRHMLFPRIHGAQQSDDAGRQAYSAGEVLELAKNNHVFDSYTAASEELVLYKHGEGTEQFYGVHVTPGTFEFFGLPALHGRVLQASDYEPGAPPVFVMRYKTWMERFGGDRSILNESFMLNGAARTLVGIMPPRFGWFEADVLIPEKLPVAAKGFADSPQYWFFLGHLKPGISRQHAEADLTLVASRLAKIHPEDYPAHFSVLLSPMGATVIGHFEATLYTLLGAVALLLLIACSNVANLMLARATTREKEFALRAALGAGRRRLVRLLMVEGLVLAMAGATLGILVAWAGMKLLVREVPPNLIPTEAVIELNAPVLMFTLCLAALTPLIFGLAPALQSSRRNLNDALRESGKGVTRGFQGKWLRDLVVVIEVALSLTLLIGAGLLVRSFVALREQRLGFEADHVFQTRLALPEDRYKTAEQATRFLRPLLARLQASPGVIDAAESSALPPYVFAETHIEIAGRPRQDDWRSLFEHVSEGYFRALRIQFKQGRSFSEAEVNNARKVAIVNETFVRKYLPNENPIGRSVLLGRLDTSSDPVRDPWFEIIGVVGNVTNREQLPVEPEVWIPYTIHQSGTHVLLVRTSQAPDSMMNTVRQEVWAADSGVALAYPGTLEDRIGQTLYAGPRFGFLLMTIFGCIGLILVAVGVYSVLAYSTTQKTHEIGIRMALGAKGTDVVELVVRNGLLLVGEGMTIGIAASLALGRLIGTQLVGVTVYDPPTLAVTTLLLTVTAAMACWIPARKAASTDPMGALRSE